MTLSSATPQVGGTPGWSWFSSIDVRQGDHPAPPAPIPGFLEGRVTLLAGAGGSGKTTLTEQLIRHLCSGRQLGRFELPPRPMVGWCIFLEDIAAMAQDRSLRAAPMGSLWEDSIQGDPGASSVRYLFGRDFLISDLKRELETATAESIAPGIVVIDHLRILIGSQPAGTSPNDWERRNLLRLVDLGNQFDVHFVVLTHLNKQGGVSGTTELINSVDTAYVIETNKEHPEWATLSCRKMRMSPENDYSLMKLHNGTWALTEQVLISEAQALGIAADVIKVLKREGPKHLSELCFHNDIPGNREGVRAALRRARERGWVRPYRGRWELVLSAGDKMMQPPLPDPDVPEDTPVDRSAPEAESPQASVPAQRDTPTDIDGHLLDDERAWDPDQEPEDKAGFRGLALLKESVKRSRMHPISVLTTEERDQLPWALANERMGGEPSWCAPGWKEIRTKVPDPEGDSYTIERELIRPDDVGDGQLLLLDRNGSFPSACSSVPLAPNRLRHAGAQGYYDKDLAGLYLVPLPEWDKDKGPHPLGRIERRAKTDSVWISTPHMKLLDRLANEQRIKRPEILDSWLGRANGSLFEHFYKEARSARAILMENGGDEYTDYKKSVSKALRLLWPKHRRSPFYRPDWRVSVVAEASVRHWVVADNAVSAGAQLVSMANTDEAAFWVQDGQLPAPYVEGLMFGQVKIKRIS